MSNELKIEELWVYPVKGCGGIRVTDSWPITTRGFLYDRNWMIVDASTGKFISQRVLPPMCLIKTELLLDQGLLAINAPGMASTLIIPTTPPVTPLPLRQVTCWAWAGKAFDCGDDAAAWFSQYLDRPVRLVRFAGENTLPGDEKHRAVDRHHFGQPNDEIAFSDQHPFLIAHIPSLKALNEMIKTQQQHSSSLEGGREAIEEEELKMNRFRPNIILSGGSAWEEDEWRLLHFQQTGLEILVAKPCSRCKVPSINQETGVQGEEPNITLENHRLGSRLGWGGEPSFKHAIFFGVQGGPVFKGDVKKGSIDATHGVVVVETTRWYKEK